MTVEQLKQEVCRRILSNLTRLTNGSSFLQHRAKEAERSQRHQVLQTAHNSAPGTTVTSSTTHVNIVNGEPYTATPTADGQGTRAAGVVPGNANAGGVGAGERY